MLLIALTPSFPLPAEPAPPADAPLSAQHRGDARALTELIDTLNHALAAEGEFDATRDQQITDILDRSHLGNAPLSTRPPAARPAQEPAPALLRPARSAHPLDFDDPSLLRVRRAWVTDLYRFAESTNAYREEELRAFQRACIEAELGRVTAILTGGTDAGIEMSARYLQSAVGRHQSLGHHQEASDALQITMLNSRLTVSLLYLASEDSLLVFESFLELYAGDSRHGVDAPQGATRVLIGNMVGSLGPENTAMAVDRADLPADLKDRLYRVVKERP